MLPVPIRYRMTVLDDGIGRYRYWMTVFSRYSISGILSLSLPVSPAAGIPSPAPVLPLPSPAPVLAFSHFLFHFLPVPRWKNAGRTPRRERISEDVEEKIGQERGKYFEERVLDDDEGSILKREGSILKMSTMTIS